MRPWKVSELGFHVLGDLLHHAQILAFDLDPDGRLNARVLHDDACADRLAPAVDVADDLHRPIHFCDEAVLGHAVAPFRPRLQRHGGFDHLDGRRIRRRIGAPELPEYPLDFGEGLQLSVHLLQNPPRFARRQPWERGRHVEDRPFLHFRHVVLLEPGHDDSGSNQQRRACRDERIPVTDGAHQRAAIASDERVLAIPAGRYVALEDPHDHDRQNEERKERRERHCRRLRECERIEQPSFTLAQEEDRQK